jgi:hypothetical protein
MDQIVALESEIVRYRTALAEFRDTFVIRHDSKWVRDRARALLR